MTRPTRPAMPRSRLWPTSPIGAWSRAARSRPTSFDATLLPANSWYYYFEYGTTVPAVMDLATQRFANPPALTEDELVPTLVNAGSDLTVDEGETINFNGLVSPEVLDPTYAWDFGDTNTASGTLTPSHAYEEQGDYTVTLTVDSSSHGTLVDTLIVSVLNVRADRRRPARTSSCFSATRSSSTAVSAIPACSTRTRSSGTSTTETTDDTTLTPSHTYLLPGTYVPRLTVTDDDGGIGFAELTVDVVAPQRHRGDKRSAGRRRHARRRDHVRHHHAEPAPGHDRGQGHREFPTCARGAWDTCWTAPRPACWNGLDWVMVGYIEPTHTEGGELLGCQDRALCPPWRSPTLERPTRK